MRFAEWPRERWWSTMDALVAPRALARERAGESFPYLDLGRLQRLRNSVADRCELAGGIVLAAEDRELLKERRALVVVGNGPSALICVHVALARNVPVVHLELADRARLTPLAGCHTRWIAPFFYDSLQGSVDGRRWRWETPEAYRDLQDPNLQALSEFDYGHERAAEVAARWREVSRRLSQRLDDGMYFNAVVGGAQLGKDRPVGYFRAARKLLPQNIDVGLVIRCRFFDSENVVLKDEADRTIFTSLPYWEPGEICVWLRQRGPLLVSGSGDGALQDFLRATWQWESLHEGAEAHMQLFPGRAFPSELQARVRRLERSYGSMLDLWDEQDHLVLKAGSAGRSDLQSVQENAEAERTAAVRQMDADVTALVEASAGHCRPTRNLTDREEVRDVFLHRKSDWFGPSYLHNHFFARLTIQLLNGSRRAPLMDHRRPLNLRYHGPAHSWNPADARSCAAAAASSHISVDRIPNPQAILVRHGKRVDQAG